ncbi:enoyl-CoA hydratase [Bordetella bronchiseptica]|nr:enoyl-CoA hydratase [Bordetella bronchiseptica]
MSQEDPRLLVKHFDNGVSLFTINRPARRNAICSKTALDLQRAFKEFDQSSQRVAVLTGAGNAAFTAGADVDDVPELWRCIPTVGITTEKPVICAVSGWCVGGGVVLAMMCDLLVATEDAQFSYPEAKLGLAQGMIAGLAARIPHKIAMEMMLLARKLDAQRAYQCGLANQVVPNGTHVEAALAMAAELADMAPLVLKMLKRFVTEGVLPKGPTEQLGRARRDMSVIEQSQDIQEGFSAYREKRKPSFTGN